MNRTPYIPSPQARRLVWLVCAVTWVIRLSFMTLQVPLSTDEREALNANSYTGAQRFFSTHNMAEQWGWIDKYSSGRILWSVGHLMWGMAVPEQGRQAYALSTLLSVFAMFALAFAARRLYGEWGFLFALLFVSLSPFFLNYSIRIIASMQMCMWLCLALWFFTKPGGGFLSWIGGGLCMGLSFGAHYSAGAAIVSMAAGLMMTNVVYVLRPGPNAATKLRNAFIMPLFGGAASLVPLIALEYWATRSMDGYIRRLFNLSNLKYDSVTQFAIPPGYWLREFFEVEPMIQVTLCALTVFLLLRASFRFRLWPYWLYTVLLLLLLRTAIHGAPERSIISLWVASAAGVIIGSVMHFLLGRGAYPRESPGIDPRPYMVMDRWGLLAAVVVQALIFTRYPRLSIMARTILGMWPVTVLGITGLAVYFFHGRFTALLRMVTVAGGAMFLIACWAATRAKSVELRAGWDNRVWTNPHTQATQYFSLVYGERYEGMARRSSDRFRVFSPANRAYPATYYEEEYHKLLKVRRRFHNLGVADMVSPEEMIYGIVRSDRPVGPNVAFPPPGAVDAPPYVQALDEQGREISPRVHPYRGYEFIFGPAQPGEIRTRSITFDFPAGTQKENTFGVEYMAISPGNSTGARVVIRAMQEGQQVKETSTPVVAASSARHLILTHQHHADTETVRFTIEIEVIASERGSEVCPPVAVYLRRPFNWLHNALPPVPEVTAGYIRAVESAQQLPNQINFYGEKNQLSLTRLGYSQAGKPLRWVSAPWSGRRRDLLMFAASSDLDPVCELSINGQKALTFAPREQDGRWRSDGVELYQMFISTDDGNHSLYFLRLPEGYSEEGQPLDLRVDITGGQTGHAWFGVRDIRSPASYLPTGRSLPGSWAEEELAEQNRKAGLGNRLFELAFPPYAN